MIAPCYMLHTIQEVAVVHVEFHQHPVALGFELLCTAREQPRETFTHGPCHT